MSLWGILQSMCVCVLWKNRRSVSLSHRAITRKQRQISNKNILSKHPKSSTPRKIISFFTVTLAFVSFEHHYDASQHIINRVLHHKQSAVVSLSLRLVHINVSLVSLSSYNLCLMLMWCYCCSVHMTEERRSTLLQIDVFCWTRDLHKLFVVWVKGFSVKHHRWCQYYYPTMLLNHHKNAWNQKWM